MVGVVKIEGLVHNVSVNEIGRFFSDHDARPDNIHLKQGPNLSTAFMIYNERLGADKCIQGDGSIFKGNRISVKLSNPLEFNNFFPGVPMIAINNEYQLADSSRAGAKVLKVDGLGPKTLTGEIRKHFKDTARPDQIYIVPGQDRQHHSGVAYLVFGEPRKADNALLLDGSFLKERKISVEVSNHFEINEGLLKVQGLHPRTTISEIRKHFKNMNSRPLDIQLVQGKHHNEHTGIAFLVFKDRVEAEGALISNGSNLKDHKLTVSMSNSREFDQYLPGAQIHKDQQQQMHSSPEYLVVKVKGLESRTVRGEIRKYFKNNDARPVDIHIVPGRDHKEHSGTAFLVFTSRKEAENALRADGTKLKDHWLTVSVSDPDEFKHYLPETSMITREQDLNQFQGVLKVEGLHTSTRRSEIRQFFKQYEGRPIDIHITRKTSDQSQILAFLAYVDQKEMDAALQVNGRYFKDKRLFVVRSSMDEFNHNFPGVAMISKIVRRPDTFNRNTYEDQPQRQRSYEGRRDRSRSPHRDKRYEERGNRSRSPRRHQQSRNIPGMSRNLPDMSRNLPDMSRNMPDMSRILPDMSRILPDMSSGPSGINNANPQLQNLLTLLTATVSVMANQQQNTSIDSPSIPSNRNFEESPRRLSQKSTTSSRPIVNANASRRMSPPARQTRQRPSRVLPPSDAGMRNLFHPVPYPSTMSREQNWNSK